MAENGNYVTRAELNAHLDPMKEDVSEIKSDVKQLIKTQTSVNVIWKLLVLVASLLSGVSYFVH